MRLDCIQKQHIEAQLSGDEVEMAGMESPCSTAGDPVDRARELIRQLVDQGVTVSMRDEIWAEMMTQVEWLIYIPIIPRLYSHQCYM